MTLHLHRAPRTDLLADGLGALLAAPLDDPFAEEVVVVPARGVERWLTQRLSHRLGVGPRGGDGVCAGVRFLNPHSLVALLLGTVDDDPWHPDRLVWPLLGVIDASLDEPWCRTLADHLGRGRAWTEQGLRASRRYSVARRLAGLFASYAVQRPTLVAGWREGRDGDGAGGALDGDLRWQPHLWRRLLQRVPAVPPDLRHADTLQRLAAGDDGLDLPDRLSLFGHTRLPVTEVELLSALGRLRDVHLWLPQASPGAWERLAEAARAGPVRRRADRSVELVRHPLLASLGRDSRELQRTLAIAGAVEHTSGAAVERADLLGWLQHDLRSDIRPDAATRAARLVTTDDRTVQVHACHGSARQVDVLREVLLGLLADDPTLEPRDILVMCPDIEAYAPLVQAGFGLGDRAVDPDGAGEHPAHRLRVRLADRALSSTNPLLAVAGRLIRLAGGRVTATEVLDLAGAAPVRHRFALNDDDLHRVGRWVGQAAIRWGLDSQHRRAYGLEAIGQNTWRFGLDRILLGVAMSEDEHRCLGSALPVDDVGSSDVDLAGRLAELVDRLDQTLRALGDASSIGSWTAALQEGVHAVASVPALDGWQVAEFERQLASIADAASDGADGDGGPTLRLADVRQLLEHRLQGRPTRANFRTGTLTVCTMVPMRSVPHRVVCLMGLDDGVFPRNTTADGDDVLARDPVTGEHDARSEDRQLLLDAIMAATERLVITYTGANEHTGAERPPAVPLGELIDALRATATPPSEPFDSLVVRHPLQPFDARNIRAGALVASDVPFSFDPAALSGALAARGPRAAVGPLVTTPLPARPASDVSLADLQAFFASPVRHFLRARLDVSAPLAAEETVDAIPVTLDGLQKWDVGDRMLRDILAGLNPEDTLTAELFRGLLPPLDLGHRTLHDVLTPVQALVNATAPLRTGPPAALDVSVDLGGGRRLTGTVPGIHGRRIVSLTYSSLKAKQRVASWINLLAIGLTYPEEQWSAHAVGKDGSHAARAVTSELDRSALGILLELVDSYDRGCREPVPLPVQTGHDYARAWVKQQQGEDADPVSSAGSAWTTNSNVPNLPPGEHDDPAHVRIYGADSPVEVLLGPPRADERWNDATTRLGQYALRLWLPLWAHEQVSRL